MSITVKQIDLGEVEGAVGVTAEGMIERINAALAEQVPDPDMYEVDAKVEWEAESGIYVATATAKHITMNDEDDRPVLSISRVTGSTREEIAAKALYRGSEFFGTDDLVVDIGDYFIDEGFSLDEEGPISSLGVKVYLNDSE